jgi:hypothetical protein
MRKNAISRGQVAGVAPNDGEIVSFVHHRRQFGEVGKFNLVNDKGEHAHETP